MNEVELQPYCGFEFHRGKQKSAVARDGQALFVWSYQARSLYITRAIISKDYVRTREELTAIMDPVFEMYLAKELEVLIGPAYPLEDAAEAHRDLESRKSTGKLVLTVGR
jgi:NADPH:quinone reductase-like Zn-dependent oxidoreductase